MVELVVVVVVVVVVEVRAVERLVDESWPTVVRVALLLRLIPLGAAAKPIREQLSELVKELMESLRVDQRRRC